MLLTVIIILSSSLLLLEVSGVRSKSLFSIPLLLLWLTFSFNRYNSDYLDYSNLFENVNATSSFEVGYGLFVKLLSYFGFGHDVIIFIVGSLLLYVIFKESKGARYSNLIILMYCLSPLFFDLNQIRNTLMYLIVILSLAFIVPKKPVEYYLGICLAFLFHKFAIVYLPLYYLNSLSRKKFLWLIIFGLTFLFSTSPLIMHILTWFMPSKMNAYLAREPGLGVLVVFVYVLLDLLTIWWVDQRVRKRASLSDKRRFEVMYRFLWLSVLILPFTFYFLEVKRMQRNAMLVKYIYSVVAMKYMTASEKIITTILLLISALLPIFIMLYNGEISDIKDIDQNLLLHYFGFYKREGV